MMATPMADILTSDLAQLDPTVGDQLQNQAPRITSTIRRSPASLAWRWPRIIDVMRSESLSSHLR